MAWFRFRRKAPAYPLAVVGTAVAVIVFLAARRHFLEPVPPAPPGPGVEAPSPPPAPPAAQEPAPVDSAAGWKNIEAMAASARSSGDYSGVLAWLRTESARRPGDAMKFDLLVRSVLDDAAARVQREAETAAVQERAGDARSAIACWERVLTFRIPEHDARARAEIARLHSADQVRRHKEALPALGPLLVRLETLLRKRRLAEAEDEILALRNRTPELSHECAWLTGTVYEAQALFTQVAEGIVGMKGERVTLPEYPGVALTIQSSDADAVTLLPPEGAPVTVAFGDLPPDVFLAAATRAGATPDYVGQFMLFTGRGAEGRRMWRNVRWRDQLDALADQVEAAKKSAR